MENYEVKGVSQATEIRKAYEEAVQANAPKYRAVSKTNLIYGWDEKTNKFIKAEIGQEWFDNPHYAAPVEETIEEPIEEMVEVANEMIKEVKAEEVKETLTTEEIDYKALYEQAQSTIKDLQDKIVSLEKIIEEKDIVNEDLQEELDDIKEAAATIKALFR